jgi:hypothetical protein
MGGKTRQCLISSTSEGLYSPDCSPGRPSVARCNRSPKSLAGSSNQSVAVKPFDPRNWPYDLPVFYPAKVRPNSSCLLTRVRNKNR